MTLKRAHLFLFPLRKLVNMVLHGILSEALKEAGGPEDLVRLLRWKLEAVNRLLAHERAPEIAGPWVLSMSLAEVQGKSLFQAKRAIQNIIVMSVADAGSNRFIARMLQVGEWDIRRIKARVRRGQVSEGPTG